MHVLAARVTSVDPPAFGAVCQRLIVVSNCIPGSAHSQAAWAIWRNRSRALTMRTAEPSVRAVRAQSASSRTACMNSSVTRTELFAFWYWMENESDPSRSMSNPPSRRTRALRSSSALHQMKSSMSGWSSLRMTILAARRVLPPDLIVPAEASAPRMNDTGPDAVPPPWSLSTDARMLDRFTPGARSTLEDDPLFPVPVEDRVHRVVDGEDEAVVYSKTGTQVLAALGLDVVDVHLLEIFDAINLERRSVRTSPGLTHRSRRSRRGTIEVCRRDVAPGGDEAP